MKLYYTPGACSLAPHMALREAGLAYDLEKVDLQAKTTEHGNDYTQINPKGYVPALELENGELLTEAGVLLQYIADLKPESGLAPALGDPERYRLMETIHFISTELHKGFGPLFAPGVSEEAKQAQLALIGKRFAYLDERLADRTWLMGEAFTVADCYLATVLSWARYIEMDLAPWPNLAGYAGRVMARPAILETFKAEGLM